MVCVVLCLVPVRLSPRPSRSIRFGDASEANGPGKPRKKQTAHAFVLFFKMADFTGLYKVLQTAADLSSDNGNGNENVTWKYNFISFVLLRDYFNSLNFYKMTNCPGTKLVGVAYKLRKKMKNSPPCLHILHKTLNVVISRCRFAEDDKEMYQNVKRTCRAIVFAH